MLGAGEDISDCRSDLGVSEGRFCGAPPNSSLAETLCYKLAAFLQPLRAGPSGVRVFAAPHRIPHSEEMLSFCAAAAAAGPQR
jgi:hypothetical protein